MATTVHRKAKPGSDKTSRSSSDGRFLSVASLKPVTKRAKITSAQADKIVKHYRETLKQ